jgi:hypothetical protein
MRNVAISRSKCWRDAYTLRFRLGSFGVKKAGFEKQRRKKSF